MAFNRSAPGGSQNNVYRGSQNNVRGAGARAVVPGFFGNIELSGTTGNPNYTLDGDIYVAGTAFYPGALILVSTSGYGTGGGISGDRYTYMASYFNGGTGLMVPVTGPELLFRAASAQPAGNWQDQFYPLNNFYILSGTTFDAYISAAADGTGLVHVAGPFAYSNYPLFTKAQYFPAAPFIFNFNSIALLGGAVPVYHYIKVSSAPGIGDENPGATQLGFSGGLIV
jgi:hypothetical protein